MALLNDGINGGFTGKAGSIIGYQLNGKWIIKGLPKLSKKNKKGTLSQNACRKKFTLMQAFLSNVLGYIKIGFNIESKSKMMTAHNAAKSYNMLHAFDEHDEIDYSKISLTYGNLIGARNPQYFSKDSGIQFTWTHETYPDYNRNYDQIMILAFNPKDNIVYSICSGSKRKSGVEVLEIPSSYKGSEFHAWISFVSDDRMSISMSSYVGLITY